MITRKAILFLLFIMSYTINCYADMSYTIYQYGKLEGISNQSIHSITKDHKGYLWIGMKQRLNRFDGVHFRSYALPHTNGTEKLECNRVTALAETSDGTIWVGTSHCLFTFNPATEQFTLFHDKRLHKIHAITQLMADKDDNVWVISSTAFMRINTKDQSVTTYEDHLSTMIIQTKAGAIWTTGFDGKLHKYNPQKDKFNTYDISLHNNKKSHQFLVALAECYDGRIAIASNNAIITFFSPTTNDITDMPVTNEDGGSEIIHTMVCKDGHNLWVGTENGIIVYRTHQENISLVKRFRKSYTDNNSLSDNAVHILYMDSENSCWVGTFFGGLNYIHGTENGINTFLPVNNNGNVSANIIREICPDGKGNLWIGTEDGGLAIFNTNQKTFCTVPLDLNGKTPYNIQSLLFDGKYLWIGTYMDGLLQVNPSTLTVIKQYTHINGKNNTLTDAIVCMLKNDEGDLLCGTFDGLFYLDHQTGIFQKVDGLENTFVHTMYMDSKNKIWIGSLNNGVFTLHNQKNRIKAKRTPFSHLNISTIYEDSHHNILIGTEGNGLYKYDEKTQTESPVNISGNQSNTIGICKIIEDYEKRLWISTSNGLYCYQPEQGSSMHLTHSNGLPSDQFNFSSGYYDENSTMYFGTYNGLVCLRPSDITMKDTPLTVLLTGIQSTDIDSGIVGDTIHLPYNHSSFHLNYSVTDFSSASTVWYRYRIKEEGNKWITCTNSQQIFFASLSPGTYTLQIQASYINGVWTNAPTVLTIIITPPFWHHPISYLIYLLSAMIIAGYTIRFFRKRSHRKLEQMQTQKQHEIMQAKISFFTTITHEIRTPLTLIMGCIEKLDANENKTVTTLRHNAERLLNLINQLLDFRKIESSRMPMNIEETDIIPLIKDVYENFIPVILQKHIHTNLCIGTKQIIILSDKEAITKIISNMMSNAVKFCNSFINIETQCLLHKEQSTMILRITNDGERIPKELEEEVFRPFVQYYGNNQKTTIKGSGLGLSLTRSLAEMQGGRFYLDSTVKDNNSFIFEMPVITTYDLQVKKEQENTHTNHKNEKTILLVDDESDLRDFVSEELKDKYTVLKATNGQNALEILKEKNVNLIVTDLMMPVMDGIELCRHLKENIQLCHIPIIVLTAKVSLQDHIDVLNAHADAYIEKPFSTTHLKAQISNLLHSRELLHSTFIHSPYAMLSDITKNKTEEEFIRKLDKIINDHLYNEEFSVDILATHMAMSNSTLYRKMKAMTSLSPNDYIRLYKLKCAARMLKEENMNVKEVAEKLGFSSTAYFTHCFMKQFGITPKEFIKG